MDLEATDADVLDRWPDIGANLAAAIRTAAAPCIAGKGRVIAVVLNEGSLRGAAALRETGEFNRLGGWVHTREEPGAPPILSEEISLEADSYVPGGTTQFVILPGRPGCFNNALVDVFAVRVVEEVQDAD